MRNRSGEPTKPVDTVLMKEIEDAQELQRMWYKQGRMNAASRVSDILTDCMGTLERGNYEDKMWSIERLRDLWR